MQKTEDYVLFYSLVKPLLCMIVAYHSDIFNQISESECYVFSRELTGEHYNEDNVKKLTPYGSRLEWNLPCNNTLHVHLKDTNKIRYKKRWSQVK